ncbi:alanine--tRNA ligase [bacterium]|nr:alanine--tRNA ligase [bacterium]
MLSGNEIRKMFLEYFKDKHQHTLVESSSLIPDNPTVLLTTAGMLQFMPYFLGLEEPKFSPARAASCQKCARAGGKDSDIENVGRTPRHHTFFEMLGNFSFGDYYKKEIIPWAWDFITNYLKLDKNRLWITIYETDDEAYDIWVNDVGVSPDRIKRKGKKDNFWGPPGATGSCGPCSEIHYDLGEHLKCSEDCGIDTCECNRWVEIWNLVFTELFQDEQGNQSPLDKKNVDTGMGLERITMVCQGVESTFETDLLKPILDEVSKMSGVPYKKSEKTDISLRIITDHIRCVTFLISDGVLPANEGRSYVLRMILRRALRHGKMLGLDLPFLHKLVDVVIKIYGESYPDLVKNQDKIKKVILSEEEKFKLTLDRGYKLLEELLAKKENISGKDAFKLYDTYGFPMELTLEIAQESGLSVDVDGFNKEMAEQKQRAKDATQKISLTDDLVYVNIEKEFGATEFIGYDEVECDSKVLATVPLENGLVDVILDKTPFYAECGGQVGDSGYLDDVEVLTTFKVNDLYIHRCRAEQMPENVHAKIDVSRREKIRLHHTNAHLLQAALVKVLGDEVKQAGSQVEENRTRFDFSFSRGVKPEELQKVENLINEWIGEKFDVTTKVMPIEEAQLTGATALFGEKYGDEVRVVSIGNVSKEFCAGTHARNIGDLRLVKIISESAISAGTRRIEAVTGVEAINYLNKKEVEIDKLARHFKALPEEVFERVEKLREENKELSKELTALKSKQAKEMFKTFVSEAKDVDGVKLLVKQIDTIEGGALREGVETLGGQIKNSVVIIVAGSTICVRVSDNLTDKYNAGKIVSELAKQCGGKGGGRPNFAQGGLGQDNALIKKALSEFKL